MEFLILFIQNGKICLKQRKGLKGPLAESYAHLVQEKG